MAARRPTPDPSDARDIPPTSVDAPDDPYDALDDLYDEWVVSVVEDIPFYVDLARHVADDLDRGSIDVVELGAGSGRITLPLVLRGHRVVAVDVAAGQLARLDRSARAAGVDALVRVEHADMRMLGDACEPASADLVIAPFRSLLHVAHERDAVLAAVRSVLRPGGWLAFDVFHPSPLAARDVDGRWLLRRTVHADEGGSWSIWERACFAADGSTLDLSVRAEPVGHDLPERRAEMHLVTPPAHEWRTSLERAGLELVSTYSWFDESPFHPAAEDSVWVARAPADATAGPAASHR